MQPEFPVTVKFDDGEEWVLNDVEEVESSLVWFDSEDAEEEATVFDRFGRLVRLKVEALQLLIFEGIEKKYEGLKEEEIS